MADTARISLRSQSRNCALTSEADRLAAFLEGIWAIIQTRRPELPDLDIEAIRHEQDLEHLAASAVVVADILVPRRFVHFTFH